MAELHTSEAHSAFLSGGGEMGERIRAFDWAGTALGPPEGWPQSLRSAVSILLPSKAQIILFWGSDQIIFYNDAYRPVFGAKHPHALGLPAREAWSEIWDDLKSLLGGVLETGEAYWASNRLFEIRRYGFLEETYFDVSYDPVRVESGEVGGVFCIVSETTGRVLGERRLKTLRDLSARTTAMRSAEEVCETAATTLAEHVLDLPFALFYLMEAGGRARLVGSFGIERGTPGGPEKIDPDDASAIWPLRQVVETDGRVAVHDLTSLFGEAEGVPRAAVVLPMRKPGQNQLSGFVVAGASPRLPFNEEYEAFLDLLAGQVAASVADARAYEEEKKRAEALAELDRAKTAFFSNISHEFRTPLTLMLGPVDDLLLKSHTDLSPAAARQLKVVDRNGKRLLRLVNTLLDFSRIEAGRVRASYQRTDLAAFTAELASVFRAAVERAGLTLTVECPKLGAPVFIDRDMWEKIVLNLLSNAFKFTFEGGITVSLGTSGGSAELCVQDTGTGIPAQEMPRLFERFHRVENAKGRTHEGSGIGLALVQELVRLHGGTIRAESIVGQGTTFVVTVPLGSSHLPAEQIAKERPLASMATGANPYVEEALRWLPNERTHAEMAGPERSTHDEAIPVSAMSDPSEPGDERLRVLVADDNTDMRDYVVRLLGERYRVQAVADGAAALERARQETPHLVLTDVMMPRLDGFQLLQALRADPRTRDVPVILLSARAGEESRVEGMEAGADDYLIKPFSARELLARVSAHLQMAQLRKEASEALRGREQELQEAQRVAHVGSWTWDVATDVMTGSEEINRIFGLEPGMQAIPKFQDQGGVLYPHEDWARLDDAAQETLRTGIGYELDLEALRGSERIWVTARSEVVRDPGGAIVGLRGTVQDITERKRAEQALREADRRKNEFLATLAHELRGPLAPVRNMLEVMRRADGNAVVLDRARDTMERQITHLVRLVDDLIDVGRITSNKLELQRESVDLASILHDAIETCRPLADERQHEVTLTLPAEAIYLDADPVRMSQVFTNLLSNAYKYTEPPGHVWVTAEREGKSVVVKVRDSGLGIPPENLGDVFDMFTQVESTMARSKGGLGIGLTLVKRLVEMHGGSVEAFSQGLGKGSEFLVRLPVRAGAPAPAGPASGGDASGGDAPVVQRRILVVDDNQDSAFSLEMLLKRAGGVTRLAHDGEEAVTAAEVFRPEIVLLDIGLPKLDGFEAARRIREKPWGKNMILIALTGWGQEDDRRKSKEAGFDDHLVKPVEFAALLSILAKRVPR